MADEFVVLEEDTWVERALPGSKQRTTRVLVGRAGTRVHRSALAEGGIVGGRDGHRAQAREDAPGSPGDEGGDEATPDAPTDEQGTASDADGPGPGDAAFEATGDEPQPDAATDPGNAPSLDPPGRNESTETWRDYALAVDVDADEDRREWIVQASRDELIEAYDTDG